MKAAVSGFGERMESRLSQRKRADSGAEQPGTMGLVDAGGTILLELTYNWLDAQYQDDLLAFRKEEGGLFYDEKKDAFYTVTGV